MELVVVKKDIGIGSIAIKTGTVMFKEVFYGTPCFRPLNSDNEYWIPFPEIYFSPLEWTIIKKE